MATCLRSGCYDRRYDQKGIEEIRSRTFKLAPIILLWRYRLRNPTAFLTDEYEELKKSELDWKLRELQGPSSTWCIVDGKKVLMFCSNNYLGLSNHPKLKEAAINAVRSHGAGSGSVRAIAGNMDLHVQLERRHNHKRRTKSREHNRWRKAVARRKRCLQAWRHG